jgi:hypothetical protein
MILPRPRHQYLHQKGFKIRKSEKHTMAGLNRARIRVLPCGKVRYVQGPAQVSGNSESALNNISISYKGFLYSLGSVFWRDPQGVVTAGLAEPIFAVLGLALIIYSFSGYACQYSLYALATWLIVTSTSFWLSMPRYTLSMFWFS